MRIAYICADKGVPLFGRKGGSVHIQEVVRALLARGAEVEIFARRIGGEPPDDLAGVPVHDLTEHLPSTPLDSERAALIANGALYALLEDAAPFDMVYERYSLWSMSGMQFAQDKRIPGLLEVNAPLVEEQATHRTLVDRDLAQRVARKVFGTASVVLSVSHEVARYVETFPEAKWKVHVVPNGVNPARFARTTNGRVPLAFPPGLASTLAGDNPGTFTIGFVGTLKPWHGLSTLAEAFCLLHREHPEARLLVVGDGPERERLEKDLERGNALGAAQFTGAVDPDDVPDLLASMDVAVAPYADKEHFYFSPLKVYEYMAAGLPVIASKVGQLDGLIEHGVNGLLCPPGDAAALADAIERLMRDPLLRASLGRSARQTVVTNHTWNAVAERILNLAESERARIDGHQRIAGRA